MNRRPDITDGLRMLKCRTLIFVGDDSSFHSEALHMAANLDRRYSALVEVLNERSHIYGSNAMLRSCQISISALNPKLENEKIKCSQSIIMDLMSYYMCNVFIWMSSSLSLLYNDASCILMLVKGSNTVL